jgi:hypothetical protein
VSLAFGCLEPVLQMLIEQAQQQTQLNILFL